MIAARCLIAACCVLATPALYAAQDRQETAQEIELTIGGSTHLLVEGVATTLRVNGRTTVVKAVRRPSQTLNVDSFSIHYPADFSLLNSNHSDDPSSASWMLKGKSCQMTIHRKEKGTTFDYLVSHMADFYAGLSSVSNLRQQPVEAYFGGRSVQGVRFLMTTKREGQNYQEYFQLPVRSSQYNYFLIIHAKPGNQEASKARSLIGNSLSG